MQITPSLSSLPDPPWLGVVAPDRVQSMGQIELNFMLNWTSENRNILICKLCINAKMKGLKWNCFWHWTCTYFKLNCLKKKQTIFCAGKETTNVVPLVLFQFTSYLSLKELTKFKLGEKMALYLCKSHRSTPRGICITLHLSSFRTQRMPHNNGLFSMYHGKSVLLYVNQIARFLTWTLKAIFISNEYSQKASVCLAH